MTHNVLLADYQVAAKVVLLSCKIMLLLLLLCDYVNWSTHELGINSFRDNLYLASFLQSFNYQVVLFTIATT